MSLNIKNPRVHALAREAATRTGQTQTSVIEEALISYLAALQKDDIEVGRRQRLRQVMADIRTTPTDDEREQSRLLQEDLYDDLGLPK